MVQTWRSVGRGRMLRASGVVVALVATVALAGCGDDAPDETATPQPDEATASGSRPDLLHTEMPAGSVEEFEQRSWCENGSEQVYLSRAFTGEQPSLTGPPGPDEVAAGLARIVPLSQVVAEQTAEEHRASALAVARAWQALDTLQRSKGGLENLTAEDEATMQDELVASERASLELRTVLDRECATEVPGYGERLLPPL